MGNFAIFFSVWLGVKFVVDFISIIFIFWRLVHHIQPHGETVGHRGDAYFLGWLGVKFVVDIITTVGYVCGHIT